MSCFLTLVVSRAVSSVLLLCSDCNALFAYVLGSCACVGVCVSQSVSFSFRLYNAIFYIFLRYALFFPHQHIVPGHTNNQLLVDSFIIFIISAICWSDHLCLYSCHCFFAIVLSNLLLCLLCVSTRWDIAKASLVLR